MSITDILSPEKIKAALESVKQSGSFDFKSFMQIVGLRGRPADQAKKVFDILARNEKEYMDTGDIRHFLQNFKDDARALNDAEIKDFMKDGDSDGNGKIGLEEFLAMLKH